MCYVISFVTVKLDFSIYIYFNSLQILSKWTFILECVGYRCSPLLGCPLCGNSGTWNELPTCDAWWSRLSEDWIRLDDLFVAVVCWWVWRIGNPGPPSDLGIHQLSGMVLAILVSERHECDPNFGTLPRKQKHSRRWTWNLQNQHCAVEEESLPVWFHFQVRDSNRDVQVFPRHD